MKNALLITGGPASGKNTLAFTIANAISQDKRTWLLCPKANELSLGPETKVVITDELRKIETIEPFFEHLNKGPFFIFISQKISSLPDEEKWTRHLAHFHLTSFYDGIIFFDHQHGNLPQKIIKTINHEMGRRQASRQYAETNNPAIPNPAL